MRERFFAKKNNNANEPADVRVARKGKWINYAEGGLAVAVGTFISPIAGAAWLIMEGAQMKLVNKYIDWRTGKNKVDTRLSLQRTAA